MIREAEEDQMVIYTPSGDPKTPESRQSKREGIKAWLEEQLGGQVSVISVGERKVELFRVEGLNLEAEPELVVTHRALDEFDFARIVQDLDQQGVPEKLRDHPTIRRLYDETHVCNPIVEFG